MRLGRVVVVEHRQLPRVTWHGYRQPAAGIDVAEKYIGHGQPALFTREPRLNYGGHVGGGPTQRKRAPIDQDHNGGFSRCMYRPDQILLHAREVEAGDIVTFAAGGAWSVPLGLADHHHGHVRFARRLGGLGDLIHAFADNVAARNVGHLGSRKFAANAFQHGHDRLGDAFGNVVAELVTPIVGIGADDGDGTHALCDRQNTAVVFQQHNASPRGIESQLPVSLTVDVMLGVLHIHIGLFEKSQPEFLCENPAHGTINQSHGDSAFPDAFDQVQHVALFERDADIHAGAEGNLARRLLVGRHSLVDQAGDAASLAEHEPPEPKLVA